MARVEALPGVQSAFASNLVPVSGGGGGGPMTIEGRPVEQSAAQTSVAFAAVTPHFFKTLNVPLLRGRDLTDAEGWSRSSLAIINEAMVKRYWPTGEPLGARIHIIGLGDDTDWFTVIGIAPNLKVNGINPDQVDPPAEAFVPYIYQQTLSTGLTIRVAGSPASITSAVRAALRSADPNIPLYQIRTMDEVRQLSFWEFGLYRWIFGTIGVVGLLLASVGVYGVLSYSVAQRTQEIGVRVALGASRRQILRLVIGYGVWLVGIGVVVGAVLAPIGTWEARAFLYNVSPFDPMTFIGVAGMLMAVALVASYLPALRATRVNPITALRGE